MPNTLFLPDDCIPTDHARQTDGYAMAGQVLARKSVRTVLDLGCGAGNSVDFFRRQIPDVRWIGVDIEDSSEVRGRRRSDADFRTYDGIHIPADDGSIDLVFSNQMMTYVRHPEPLLEHVRRVLKPDGCFVGSTSQLEPVVSNSHRSFTAHGFNVLLEAAGLRLVEIRPGIDGFTLILRRLIWRPWLDRFFGPTESPVNRLIDVVGRMRGRSARYINMRKLLVAGQFSFCAEPA